MTPQAYPSYVASCRECKRHKLSTLTRYDTRVFILTCFHFFCLYSCSFWLRYGILTNEQSIVMVNIIGATLFLIYTLVYYVFTVNKRAYVKQFAVVLTLLIGVVVFTNNLQGEPQKMIHITGELDLVSVYTYIRFQLVQQLITFYMISGIMCCIVTVCFFAAPLTSLVHVIRVKNSESLPLPLIATSFFVSLQWLIYGVLISDSFIQVQFFPLFTLHLIFSMPFCIFKYST